MPISQKKILTQFENRYVDTLYVLAGNSKETYMRQLKSFWFHYF